MWKSDVINPFDAGLLHLFCASLFNVNVTKGPSFLTSVTAKEVATVKSSVSKKKSKPLRQICVALLSANHKSSLPKLTTNSDKENDDRKRL